MALKPHTAHRTPHTVLYLSSVKTCFKGLGLFLLFGFMSSLLLFSCQKIVSEAEINQNVVTENRDGESGQIFGCGNPPQNEGCRDPESHSVMLNVSGCQLKVDFKSRYCEIGTFGASRINIYDFSIDWVNSLRCNKIGLINNAIPINGIGDWTPFFVLYGDLFRQVSRAAEQFVLDFYKATSQENHTLDFWESHCQKACITPQVDIYDPENPQIPQWTFHTCSVDGCCFRSTTYVYNFGSKIWEVGYSWVNPGGACQPQIPVNCTSGGSECKEPCYKL